MIANIPNSIAENGLCRGEDLLFNAYAMDSAELVMTIPDVVYNYRLGGITSTNVRLIDDLFSYKDMIDSFLAVKAPVPKPLLDVEFAAYTLSILLKRYQNNARSPIGDLRGFYAHYYFNLICL